MNEIATGTALRLRLRTLLDSHDRQAVLAELVELAVSTEAEREPEVALAAFEAVTDSFATRESAQLNMAANGYCAAARAARPAEKSFSVISFAA